MYIALIDPDILARHMNTKLKIAGWVSMGVVAGSLTTMSLQSIARGALAPLPLEELQQLAAVFGMVKSDYVEPVDEKKLISDAITGMVAALTRTASILIKNPSKNSAKAPLAALWAWALKSAKKKAM